MHHNRIRKVDARTCAVGPDAVIRDMSDEGHEAFGAPTRVAYEPRRSRLSVADSSLDRVVPLVIPRIAPELATKRHRPPAPAAAPRKVRG